LGPADLQEVLAHVTPHRHPDLLVGLARSDDAAVYRLNAEQAVIQTVDFFPPIVDDPYLYGAVAAANAMSDVYAMGGRVLLALNVAGFPQDFPRDVVGRIFQGGADKVAEAGAVLAGGHTVTDNEPKYGLCVTGLVHPDRVMVKGGLVPGHRLYLSKPLGTGVVATAAKGDRAAASDARDAVQSMARLNRAAAETIRELGVRGCTDVTGFGFLGHASEMVRASGCGIRVAAEAVPVLSGAVGYAERGFVTGGLKRNRAFLNGLVAGEALALSIARTVPQALVDLLFDSETSGGLLFSLPPEHASGIAARFADRGESVWEIGEVIPELAIRIL
jgi:selenide, water dikinase